MKKLLFCMLLAACSLCSHAQSGSLTATVWLNAQNQCYFDYNTQQVIPIKVYLVNGKTFYTNCTNDNIVKPIPKGFAPAFDHIWSTPCNCVPNTGHHPGPAAIQAMTLKIDKLAGDLFMKGKIKSADETTIQFTFDKRQTLVAPTSDFLQYAKKLPDSVQKAIRLKAQAYLKTDNTNSPIKKLIAN